MSKRAASALDEAVKEAVREGLQEYLPEILPKILRAAGAAPAFSPDAQMSKTDADTSDGKRRIGIPEMCKRLGIARATLMRRERQGTIPKRKAWPDGTKAWLQADLDAWMDRSSRCCRLSSPMA